MYGNGFLSRGFTDQREILYGGLATPRTGLLPFWGIPPGMAEFLASTGVVWWDMLLADALAQFFCYSKNLSWVWSPFTDEKHHPGQEGLQ